jgi:hypothetical protein
MSTTTIDESKGIALSIDSNMSFINDFRKSGIINNSKMMDFIISYTQKLLESDEFIDFSSIKVLEMFLQKPQIDSE